MKQGVITVYVLVFGTIFLLFLAGLLGFILMQLRLSEQKIAWQQSLNIAEAGLNYYKWCLNNNIENCQLEKEYQDASGKTIGKFQVKPQTFLSCGMISSQKILSTGWTLKFPQIKRSVFAFFQRESVAKYNYILNSNVWAGPDHLILGPYHSNGGIRFDGTNLSTVFSAREKWVCTSSFGCGPQGVGHGIGLCPPECQIINFECVCPGVFSTTKNSNKDLFSFPLPPFDFSAITVNLAQIKNLTKDQRLGLYFGPSQAFGYHVLINKDNLKVWKVTEVNWLDGICTIVNEEVICDGSPCKPECPICVSGKCAVKEPTIKKEVLIFDGQIPTDCGVLFFEDNVWIGNENQTSTIKGKITLASANLIEPAKKTSIWLQGNIDYTKYDGSDGFLAISQGNNLIGLYSPNYLTLRGIFVAQNGFFGRNNYPCSKYSPYCIRESLKIFGSIVSNQRVGTQWVTLGGQIVSGYKKRDSFPDANLIYNPPLFTPFLSPTFKIFGWEEK